VTSVDATCGGIVAQGSGSFTPPGTTGRPVSIIAAGPTAAESWTFMDSTGANQLEASGAFAWTNTGEIQNCLGGGTLTVTLAGSLVVVA
jgi:hypothetical protein